MVMSKYFEKIGFSFEAGGNQPILLDGKNWVWIVQSGQMDIFSVPLEGKEPEGVRTHLFQARKGEALFGSDCSQSGKGIGLLAVGVTGSRLLRVERDCLTKCFEDARQRESLLQLFHNWIRGLTAAIAGWNKPAQESFELTAASEIQLENDTAAHVAKGLFFCRLLKGKARFMGRSDWPQLDEGRLWPLASGTWLQFAGKTELSTFSAQKVNSSSCWKALDFFHDIMLQGLTVEIQKTEQAAISIQHRRSMADSQRLSNALSGFMNILGKKAARASVRPDPDNPLQAACEMVGSTLGLTVKTPLPAQIGKQGKATLLDIARVSRFRTREVLLRDDWWRKDSDPILGTLENRKIPVALLPVSARCYELWNPVDGSRRKVSKDLSETLSPKAHVLYRPFPDKTLSIKDILKMGMTGGCRDILMIALMGVAGGLLGLLMPIMTGIIFDTIIPEASRNQMMQLAVILISVVIAQTLFQVTRGIALVRLEGRMSVRVQSAVWDRLLSLPVPFFRDYTAGDLANRSMGINAIRKTLSGVTLGAVLACIFSVFYLALLFYYDSGMALLAMGLAMTMLLVTLLINFLQLRQQRPLMTLEGKNAGMLLQFITGIAKLRVSGTEDRAFAEWAKTITQKRKLAYKAGTLENIQVTFSGAFPIIASMAIFAWMVFKIKSGMMSTGKFLAFNAAYASFQTALLQMAGVVTTSLAVIPLFERAKPILSTLPEIDENKSPPGNLSGDLEAKSINFRYSLDGPLILKEVSIGIRPGEFVAIVGGSGSGKSTLMRLLLGFEKPEAGSIYYDGQPLDTLDIREVRRQIGVVLQNGMLMQGSIFENIVGQSGLTIEDAWKAARMVGIEEDIKAMPMGMHTMVSAGGGTLSGGQRQRLIIARAIVKRPPILFFDEATSALDNRTQVIVSESLERLNVSRIVIAHRLSTIINADRIYVLDKGEMVQCGTYEELMAREGLFAELAKRQIA